LVDVVQENTFLNDVGVQMKKNTRFQTMRNRWVIVIAMVLSFFVYMLAGVVGYLHVRRTRRLRGGTETGHAERRDGYVLLRLGSESGSASARPHALPPHTTLAFGEEPTSCTATQLSAGADDARGCWMAPNAVR
jgi:hypothetical protein